MGIRKGIFFNRPPASGKSILPSVVQFLLISFVLATIHTVSAQSEPNAGPAAGGSITVRGITAKIDSAGGRSELSITEFITSKLPQFMSIYAARLLQRPGLSGKITFNFAIDESGSVPFCNIINPSLGDDTLEDRLADFIMGWKFEKSDKPGNITVVTYPFDFSQESAPGAETLALGADTTGSRSTESIFRSIKEQSSVFKKIYRDRCAEKPGLKGNVRFKFAINESGNVMYCKVDSSTVNDKTLENLLAASIAKWKFEISDVPGDLLVVTYPFVFSSGTESDAAFIATVAVILALCLLAAGLVL
jgi:hypothetical protein